MFIVLSLPSFVNAQFGDSQCLYDYDPSIDYPLNFQGIYESENGFVLPANGTIRLLMVFAEIDYDTGTDPNPNSTDDWTVHQLPDWADDLFDPNTPTGQATGEVTRYFQEASFGNYLVLGDYLLE